MSIRKNKKTGKWDAYFNVRKPDGTLSKTTKRGFATKADAMRYEATHIHDASLSAADTFRTMFESMTQACNASEPTSKQRRNRINKYCASIADRPMKSITKSDFNAWRETMPSYGRATRTVNDIINLVKQVTRHAWETYDVPDNAKGLKPFKPTLKDHKEMVIINYNQLMQILDEEDDENMYIFYRLLYMTGMRRGEAKALYKSDYDATTKSLHIYKSMRLGESTLKTTKTGEQRWIPVDNTTAKMLEKLINQPGKYMFGGFLPLSNNKIETHFKDDLEKAGMPDMRVHDLRHSHASLLWNSGVPVPEISKRLGHSSSKTTMAIYAHIFDTQQTATLNVLNNL